MPPMPAMSCASRPTGWANQAGKPSPIKVVGNATTAEAKSMMLVKPSTMTPVRLLSPEETGP